MSQVSWAIAEGNKDCGDLSCQKSDVSHPFLDSTESPPIFWKSYANGRIELNENSVYINASTSWGFRLTKANFGANYSQTFVVIVSRKVEMHADRLTMWRSTLPQFTSVVLMEFIIHHTIILFSLELLSQIKAKLGGMSIARRIFRCEIWDDNTRQMHNGKLSCNQSRHLGMHFRNKTYIYTHVQSSCEQVLATTNLLLFTCRAYPVI